ncbi:D-2-hydroxyacid dehydrogenase [Paratractidigestivibacter sp.]|uniref:D-2-hydroxyacid dehydrogenase n=1 Tax=Paratractidigestivibacter sp. TaxID=2847316 RepID=UPI002ABD3317|nr:D-2-hydroxyacid dehydrogenase [Paratractidigestivibacter sp.]
MRILVLPPVNNSHKATLEEAAPGAEFVYSSPAEVNETQVEDVDVIFGNVRPPLLGAASRLRLLQLNSAGYDKYVACGTVPAGCALCCATGAYGQAVSEHLFASALCLMKKLPSYRDLQREHTWGDLGEVRSPAGANVLVLGAGDIGTHVARLFSGVGAHVCGVRRARVAAEPPFERMATMDELPGLLACADVVCSVLPSTPATRGLASGEFFGAMKPGAYFCNAGRGDLVDQAALVAALESGHLAGAALDVCSPEPLPEGDALWDAPNLLLTPHISGFYHLPVTLDNIVAIAAENLAHLAAGEPLRNHVEF